MNEKTKQPGRIVGYIRGSTEEQKNTLEAQENQIRAYCAYQELELSAVFVESGESAFSCELRDRPKAAEMIAYMKAHGIRQIVFTKLDRAFRNAKDCLQTVDDFREDKIDVHVLDIRLDTRTPEGRFVLTVMAAVAELENGRRAQRQRDAFAVMRNNGQRCGAVPYGWDAIPSTRVSKTGNQASDLVSNEFEQRVLVFMKAARETMSANEVARQLNSRGIPAKNKGNLMSRKDKATGKIETWVCDGAWYGASVDAVLKNARFAEAQPAVKAA